MNKSAVFLLFLLFLSLKSFSQSPEAYQRAGDKAMLAEDYFSATSYYKSALDLSSPSNELYFKIAESSRLFNDYFTAATYYQMLITEGGTTDYPMSVFWLATMKKMLGLYPEAKSLFNQFFSMQSDTTTFFARKAARESEACEDAPAIISDSLLINVELLKGPVNTRFSDFAPHYKEENKIYFSTTRFLSKPASKGETPVYVTRISEAEITGTGRAKELPSTINHPELNNANSTINRDGKTIYFVRCPAGFKGSQSCKIFVSSYDGKRWSPADEVVELNAEGFTTTQPFLVEQKSGTIIYFVSNRDGGSGALDIWYSTMNENGAFLPPINCGPLINTPEDDIAPYYDTLEQTIYFSSLWHIGLGGWDIFFSKGSKNQWQQPQNAGYPINSSYHDLFYQKNPFDRTIAVIASNRPEAKNLQGSSCCYDIFLISEKDTTTTLPVATTPPETEPEVILRNLLHMLPLTLYFDNDEPDKRSRRDTTTNSYNQLYHSYINRKQDYLRVFNEKQQSERWNPQLINSFFDEATNNFNNLNQFLDQLLNGLNNGNSYHLLLRAYASPLAQTTYNKILAHRRIVSLINYLHTWQNGALMPYIRSKDLKLSEQPLGESQTPENVSDDPNDQAAIYHPEAARQRKIEIIDIESEIE